MHVGVATGTGYGDDAVSGVCVILVNLAIIPASVVMVRADARTRATKAEERRKLYDKLKTAEVEDRKKYDLAWQGYVNEDPSAEATLLGRLLRLKARVDDAAAAAGITTVAHPVSAGRDLDELMRTAEASNDAMHERAKALCMAMGALEYTQGPVKKKERVEEKMAADYGGDFRQVIGKSNRAERGWKPAQHTAPPRTTATNGCQIPNQPSTNRPNLPRPLPTLLLQT